KEESMLTSQQWKQINHSKGDLEEEKRRLQSIFAVGKEESSSSESPRKIPVQEPEASEIDHFQEVLNEIEERRQFLADMAALGQEDRYADMINTEISQLRVGKDTRRRLLGLNSSDLLQIITDLH
uniref:Uncharacterized protein n=1 Tax=Nothobranchius furzeri TaxID=105023 RepID=A0A8C6L6L0_NOTFU